MRVEDWSTCALCPRLCRPACPVATATGREAAVPAVIAARVVDRIRGGLEEEVAREAVTLCTDCGACRRHCLLDRPLPELLREARGAWLSAPAIAPLQTIEGAEGPIVVEADERPLARAVARALDRPVRRWPTGDRLGVAAVEHEVFTPHATAIRAAVGTSEVWLTDGGVARALEASGVSYRWLQEVLDLPPAVGSCTAPGQPPPLACCGGAGPLAAHHPEDAARLARAWARSLDGRTVADARCRGHLKACGIEVTDVWDAWLAALEEQR